LFELNIALFVLGIFLGFLSGFVPGIHSNTVIAVIASLGLISDDFGSLVIGLFPAHLISAFIPSIFFGIPEQGAVIAVLPGQRLVLDGLGIVALKSVLVGCVFASLICVVIFGPSIEIYKFVYYGIKEHLKWIIIAIVGVLIFRSKKPHLSLLILLLSGALGKFSLGSEMTDPFLPLFSGLFAMGAILNYSSRKIPKQVDGPIDRGILKYAAIGVVLGMFADLLPGIGSPSQVATFATLAMPLRSIGFLVTISSIAISEGLFSLSTTVAINKSRMGATAALSDAINVEANLTLLLVLALISITVVVGTIFILRKRIGNLANIDFSKANIILAIYLLLISGLINGVLGIVIFALASDLGWITVKMGVERTNLMGAVIVPTLLLLFKVFI
jgi:putative membrane protein